MIFPSKQNKITGEPGTVLLLQVPRTNDKKELAAEQMLASLHGLLHGNRHSLFGSQATRERISFEIAVKNRRIGFYVWVPAELKSFVEEQIYAQYPTVHISEVEDYTMSEHTQPVSQLSAEILLTAPNPLPIKTFPSFEVDPLASITATLAQFSEDEEAWIQVVIRPAMDGWHKKSERYAAKVRGSGITMPGLATALWTPPEGGSGSGTPKVSESQSIRARAAEEKSQKLAYELSIRVVYMGQTSPTQARMRLQAITASFKQFNTTYLNGFMQKILGSDQKYVETYRQRLVGRNYLICNIEEVASLYHLPHTNVETPNILWSNAKTAEPPATLPIASDQNRMDVSPVAITNFRGHNTVFGLDRADRGKHLYIIGQTGTGKSGLLELLTISDLYSPFGFAVVDPHGDYAQAVLQRIPEHRLKDVIYFNPSDTDFPIAFNPMEIYDSKLKTHTVSELIGVLKRMFESWGPRLEYILRYSLLALLDYPDATMLDITRILTEKKFREEVLSHVADPVVRNFWLVEFASWNERFAAEAVAPVLNKVGAFTANPVVRNIIGQPKSSFNIRQIMDERKILIVNLSRGLIGEDNASLLGALLVTKIQMAAMSRANVDPSQRVPFYLYVDEFQNFATDSFATILSEARKYGLNLTVANQYIAQMLETVRDAVFGNVGSIISFRTSADDARTMQRYFEPAFEEHDLVHMHNRHFAISMTIQGEKVQAFSATTIDLPPSPPDRTDDIIAESRKQFAFNKSQVEEYIQERYIKKTVSKPNPKKIETVATPAPKSPSANPVQKDTANHKTDNRPSPVLAEPKRVGVMAGIIGSLMSGAKDIPAAKIETENNSQPKKRRRTRKRRPKNAPTTQPGPNVAGDSTTLKIQH